MSMGRCSVTRKFGLVDSLDPLSALNVVCESECIRVVHTFGLVFTHPTRSAQGNCGIAPAKCLVPGPSAQRNSQRKQLARRPPALYDRGSHDAPILPFRI